eukprot:symbB.v1.2.033238.t1/scaffold4102.1/size44650/4
MVRFFLVGLAGLLAKGHNVEVGSHHQSNPFFGEDLIDRYIKETSDLHQAQAASTHGRGHQKLRGGQADDKTGHVVTIKLDSNLQVAESLK